MKILNGILAALSIGIVACGEDSQRAGGEDFPNTVADFGDTILQLVAASSDVGVGLEGTPGLTGSFSVDAVAIQQAEAQSQTHAMLARTTAALIADSVSFDLSDTSSGVLYMVNTSAFDGGTQVDTIAVRWDDSARDVTEGNENILWVQGVRSWYSGAVENYSYRDADGDSVAVLNGQCNPMVGDTCQAARMTSQTVLLNGRSRVSELVVASGPDSDFDSEQDNGILAEKNFTLGLSGDTLQLEEATDADADGWVIAPGTDSSRLYWRSLKNGPTEAWHQQIAGMIHFPADTTRNQVFFFSDSLQSLLGGTRSIRLVTPVEGRVIQAGDTVEVLRIVTPPLFSGEVDTIHETIGLIAGQGFAESENRLLSWEQESRPSFGEVRARRFSIRSTTALGAGESPQSATFRFERELRSDSLLWIAGEFDSAGIHAEWGDQDGSKGMISWDAAGNPSED